MLSANNGSHGSNSSTATSTPDRNSERADDASSGPPGDGTPPGSAPRETSIQSQRVQDAVECYWRDTELMWAAMTEAARVVHGGPSSGDVIILPTHNSRSNVPARMSVRALFYRMLLHLCAVVAIVSVSDSATSTL